MNANLAGRLAAVRYWALKGRTEIIESYGYGTGGVISKKRMRVKSRWTTAGNMQWLQQTMDANSVYIYLWLRIA